jgi:hypothetical protein
MISGLLAVLALGTVALVTPEAEAKGPCICPKIYAPVVCKGGKVYSNQCVADCRNARDCEPLGTL